MGSVYSINGDTNFNGGGGGGSSIAGTTIAGSIISSITDIATGFINAGMIKNAADFNAKMAEFQGRMNKIGSNVTIKRLRAASREIIGAQRAHTAKAGFAFEGSPVDIALKSQSEVEKDIIYEQINADYQQSLIKTQSDIYRLKGQQAKYGAWQNTAKTVLGMTTKFMQEM